MSEVITLQNLAKEFNLIKNDLSSKVKALSDGESFKSIYEQLEILNESSKNKVKAFNSISDQLSKLVEIKSKRIANNQTSPIDASLFKGIESKFDILIKSVQEGFAYTNVLQAAMEGDAKYLALSAFAKTNLELQSIIRRAGDIKKKSPEDKKDGGGTPIQLTSLVNESNIAASKTVVSTIINLKAIVDGLSNIKDNASTAKDVLNALGENFAPSLQNILKFFDSDTSFITPEKIVAINGGFKSFTTVLSSLSVLGIKKFSDIKDALGNVIAINTENSPIENFNETFKNLLEVPLNSFDNLSEIFKSLDKVYLGDYEEIEGKRTYKSEVVATTFKKLVQSFIFGQDVQKMVESVSYLQSVDIGNSIVDFINPIVSNKDLMGIASTSSESILKDELHAKIAALDPTDPQYNEKLLGYQNQIKALGEPDSKGEMLVDFVKNFTTIFGQFGVLKDLGYGTMFKLKMLGSVDIGGILSKFINNLISGDWVDKLLEPLSQETQDLAIIDQKIYDIERKPLKTNSDRETLNRLLEEKKNLLSNRTTKGASIPEIINALVSTIGSISGIAESGVSGFTRFKAISNLGFGKVISTFINDISSNLNDSFDKDFSEAIDTLQKIPGMIGEFADKFPGIYLKIKGLTALNPGVLIGAFLKGMTFDIGKILGSEFEASAQLLYSQTKGTDLLIQKDKLSGQPNSQAAIESLEAIYNSGKPTGAAAWKFLMDYQLTNLSSVVKLMGEIGEMTYKMLPKVLLMAPAGMAMGTSFYLFIESLSKITGNKNSGLISFFGNVDTGTGTLNLKDGAKTITEIFTHLGNIIRIIGNLPLFKLAFLSRSLPGAEKTIDALIGNKKSIGIFDKFSKKAPSNGIISKLIIIKDLLKDLSNDPVTVVNNKLMFEFLNTITKVISNLAGAALLIPFATISITFIVGIISLLKLISVTSRFGLIAVGRFSSSIRGLGLSIIMLAIAAPFVPIALITIAFVVASLFLFNLISSIRITKNIFFATKNLGKMGGSILKFVIFAALAGYITSIAYKQIALGMLVIFATIMMFSLIGILSKPIKEGREAIMGIALGMIVFSLGLLALTLVMMISPMHTALGLVAMLGVMFILFLLGSRDKQIYEGAKALILISLSLIIFSIGLIVLNFSMRGMTWEKLAMAGAVFLVLGFAAFILGALDQSDMIKKGTTALILIGVSLIIFSVGLLVLNKGMEGMTWEKIGMAGAVFGALALAVGIFGAIAVSGIGAIGLAAGIAAIAGIGLSLIIFSVGLKLLSGVTPWDKETSKKFPIMINAIVDGFLSTVTSTVAGIPVPNPFKAASLLASIPLVLGMGVALIAVSGGISKAMETPWEKVPIDKIKSTLVGLGEAFAAVGAEDTGGGIGKLLSMASFGLLGPKKVKTGIAAVLDAGKALTSVSQGIKAFWDMTKEMTEDAWATDEKGKPTPTSLSGKIAVVLGVVNKAFSDIGASGNTGTSYMKLLFGNDFKKSDVEVGINSVLNVGKALTSATEGITAFWNTVKSMPKEAWARDSKGNFVAGSLPFAITEILGVVSAAFAGIGKSKNEGTSLLKMVFGTDLKDSDVEAGIKSVRHVGQAFTSITDGIKAIMDIQKTIGGNMKAVKAYIIDTVTMVMNAFIMIGKKEFEIDEDKLSSLKNSSKDLISIVDNFKRLTVDTKPGALSPMFTFANDLTVLSGTLRTITPMELATFGKIAWNFKLIGEAGTGFEKFAKANQQFTKDFKEQFKAIHDVKLDNLKETIHLHNKFIEIMKLDKNVFQENMKLMKEFMIAIKEAAEGNIEALTELATKIKESGMFEKTPETPNGGLFGSNNSLLQNNQQGTFKPTNNSEMNSSEVLGKLNKMIEVMTIEGIRIIPPR